MKTIAAADFKARWLTLMDDVQSTREHIVITKRGKPVAKLVPMNGGKPEFLGRLKGVIEIVETLNPGGTAGRMGRAEMILLDTHALVWSSVDTKRLSNDAIHAIEKARRKEDGLAISGSQEPAAESDLVIRKKRADMPASHKLQTLQIFSRNTPAPNA